MYNFLFLLFSHKFKLFLFKLLFSLHIRSSRPEGFCKISVPKNFPKLTGNYLCWSLFLINLQAKPATLLKRDSNTSVFLWILRDFWEDLWWLLLTYLHSLFFIYPIFLQQSSQRQVKLIIKFHLHYSGQ